MSLTGPMFLGTLVVLTVAAFAAVVLAWPSLGRQGVPRVAGRIGMLLGLNGLVLLTAAAQLNAQFIFFADWTDLRGFARWPRWSKTRPSSVASRLSGAATGRDSRTCRTTSSTPGAGSPSRRGLSMADPYRFGTRSEVYNGFDLNLAARFGKGGTLSGGWNIGNTFVSGSVVGTTFSKTNNCFVVDSPQQLYNCESQNPYQSRIKFNGSYPLPGDFRVAAVFQSLPAANYGANYTVSSAAIQPSLGRPLAGGTANVTIDLLPQGAIYLDERILQVDARLTKLFRFASRKIQANLDVFNVFNSSTVLQVNSTFGQNWLKPTQILDGRLLKFGVQVDF